MLLISSLELLPEASAFMGLGATALSTAAGAGARLGSPPDRPSHPSR
jgi:hypothetical protein